MTAARVRWLLVLALAGAGCVSTSAGSGAPAKVWPEAPEEPRVRLERVFTTERDVRKGRTLLSLLAGREAAPLFGRPYGVAWVGEDLAVTDPAAGQLVVIGADGRVDRTPDGLLEGPMGIAACQGRIVVTEPAAGRVSVVSADLARRESLAEGLERPTGVACAGSDIFVLETARHAVWFRRADGRTGTFGRRGVANGEFNYPTAIVASGRVLLVGDTLNFRVQKLDAETGQNVGTFGRLGDAAGETPRIKGIGVDSNGRVWVTDALLDQVALYEQDGAYLMALGGNGTEPGSFAFPSGVAGHADGRVAVVDSLGRRVQIFRVLPAGGSDAR